MPSTHLKSHILTKQVLTSESLGPVYNTYSINNTPYKSSATTDHPQVLCDPLSKTLTNTLGNTVCAAEKFMHVLVTLVHTDTILKLVDTSIRKIRNFKQSTRI